MAKSGRRAKNGLKFSIEGIAAKYRLDLFEKRIFLFFLYLEYCAIETNICTEDELLCIFDTEDSYYPGCAI